MPSIIHDESHDAIQTPHVYNEPQHLIRILHIDDDLDLLQLVKLFLEREDPAFQVDYVSSGKKALERLKEQQYDCIVSDYVMPGMNGINLAYRIREISDVPFVLYTGQGSEEVASAAFAAGVNDYMRKEIDPSHYEVLARRIRTAVEKRRVENALIESERKYRSLVLDSRDGIMVFAGEELIFANQQAATLHGYDSVEELMKVGPGTLLYPEDKEYVEVRSLARQHGEDISPVTGFRVVRPDGTVRDMESSSSLIQYDGKNSTLAFIRDVTERKQAEQALKESEEKYRKLFEEALDAIFVAQVDTGLIIDCNRAACELVGRERSELVGEHQRILHPYETIEGNMSVTFKQHLEEREGQVLETQVITKQGEIKEVAIKGSIFELNGKKVIQGIFRDITKHKRYEERLHALHLHAVELNSAETVEEVFASTYEAMDSCLRFDRIDVIKVEDGFLIDVLRKDSQREPVRLPMTGKGITVRAAKTVETQLVPDVRIDPDYVQFRHEALSELAVPVVLNGETVAVLNVESAELNAFTEEDRDLLETLALTVSSVLEGLREKIKKQTYRKNLEALHRHAVKLGLTETMEDIAEQTFSAIEGVLGFDLGSFGVVEGCLLRHILVRGFEAEEAFEMLLDGRGVTVRAVRTGETQLVPDIREDEDFVPGFAEGVYESLSELAVPVKIGGEVVAVINIESTRLDAFTDNDRRLLEIFAEHVASAISRLRREEMLRASEEKWRTLLEESMDAVSVIVGLKIVYVNQSYVELLGLGDPSEAIGRNALDFAAVEDRERIRRMAIGRQRGEDHPTRYEFKMLKADGTQIDVENYVTDIEYKGEKASLSFVRDITERKIMEEELRVSEQRFKDVVDNAFEWVWEVDANGKYVYSSSVVEKILGYTPEEIIGKHFYDLFHPDDREKLKEEIFDVFEKKQPHHDFRNRNLNKNGGTVWLSTSSVPMLDNAGNLIGYRGVDQDITEKVLTEEKLRKYTEHLEEIVNKKTMELLDAERIVAAGTVAAMLGHDLRGPLQTINNAVYLLRKALDGDDETLNTIERAVERATQMLEEFRSQTRDTPLSLVSTDLAALINASVEEAQVPNSVNVVVHIGDGLEDVFVDPQKMRRVLDNLLDNAVDSKPDSVVITVSAERTEDKVTIKVSDTGVGISNEEMLNLFKPFHTTKRKGLGLGLAYCKRAVEAHSGTITVESEVGEGTTFTIHIPIKTRLKTINPN